MLRSMEEMSDGSAGLEQRRWWISITAFVEEELFVVISRELIEQKLSKGSKISSKISLMCVETT